MPSSRLGTYVIHRKEEKMARISEKNKRSGNVVCYSLLALLLGLGRASKAAAAELQGAPDTCTRHYQAVL